MAAVVLTGHSVEEELELLDSFRSPYGADWQRGLSFDELVDRLDLSDPAGRMALGPLLFLATTYITTEQVPWGFPERPPLDDLLSAVRGVGRDDVERRRHVLRILTSVPFLGGADLRRQLWGPVVARDGLSAEDAARHAVRLLFKAAGYPERVVEAPDGRLLVEVRDGDDVRLVDPLLVYEVPDVDVVETVWDRR